MYRARHVLLLFSSLIVYSRELHCFRILDKKSKCLRLSSRQPLSSHSVHNCYKNEKKEDGRTEFPYPLSDILWFYSGL